MKIITLTKEEFQKFSDQNNYNTLYQSVDYAEFAKKNDHFNIHYLGFVEEGKLIGASLMLYKTLFWGYKYAYAPRGFLIDYDNKSVVTTLTENLKNLLKKQKFIFIKIDPPVVLNERDKEGNIINTNENANTLLKLFKKNGYEHLGFNLYNETQLSRWNVLAPLTKDGRLIFNSYNALIKEKISYANNISLKVIEDTEIDINKFYENSKLNSSKKGLSYLQNIKSSFESNKKIKIFYATLDTKKFVVNANELYAKEEEKNQTLAEIIQSGDNTKYNIAKAINDKIVSDKLLHTYKKDIVSSTKLLKKYPDGIICGAALTILEARGVNILINYSNQDYEKYNANTLLIYEIMKYFGKLGYEYINLGPITGNFDENSKYYSLLTNKIGFNSSILEYIGEFNIILNPTMYRIYKRKYKK